MAESYNRFKEFDGRQYSGMSVGRSHKWYYDQGEWKETKITPDLWQLHYAVTKRRAGKAPEGSGAKVGTGYHWMILAHQTVVKLNSDDYSTVMTGLKQKIAHKRADKGQWSRTAPTQRKNIIAFLKEMLETLEKSVFPLEFEFNGTGYKGEAIPIMQACHDGHCFSFDITLNGDNLGIIRRLKNNWKLEGVTDKKFIKAIGQELEKLYTP